MSDQIISNNLENTQTQNPQIAQIETPNEPKTQTYQLKKGFMMNLDQRKKIVNMPMKGFVMTNITDENGHQKSAFDVGLLMENQRELVEYLMKLFYEPEIDLLTISNEEYSRLENEIKAKNPFKVFDIKMK